MESRILSEGYEDDDDQGDEVIYTRHVGRHPNTGRQIHDLGFVRGNKALAEEQDRWASGKVTRGADLHSPYAPRSDVSA